MRLGPALLLAAGLAACAVHRRASDPAPVASAPIDVAPILVDQSTVPFGAAAAAGSPAEPPPPQDNSNPVSALSTRADSGGARSGGRERPPRQWGLVAITTAISSPSQLLGPEVPYSPEYRPLPAFPETLVFEMSWGLLSVGAATLSVDKIVMFNGRPAYHLVSEARSNAFCDTFYMVRDLNESWLDARTLTSLGYSKKVREGKFFRDEWVLYDRDAATFVNRRVNRDGSFSVRTGTIPARVNDILSSIYYTRAQPLAPGGDVRVDVNTPDNWALLVMIRQRETIKVPAGRFASVQVEPVMVREGLFVQKGKRLRLWFSDDPQKRLLMMKAEVFFGNVTASLREML